MKEKIISICKCGVRYDIPIKKQEPIASDEPVISEGAIVSMNGHKGKVLQTEGDVASVSWEDASISKVPIKGLKYEGRVTKGGPGSGRKPGSGKTGNITQTPDGMHRVSYRFQGNKSREKIFSSKAEAVAFLHDMSLEDAHDWLATKKRPE